MKTVDLKLNEEQEIAYNSMEYSGKYLLYGVTGSGKTEIYLQLIEKIIKEEKSAIFSTNSCDNSRGFPCPE